MNTSTTIILIVAVVLFGVFRRARVTFGAQPLRTGYLFYRIGLYALLSILVVGSSLASLASTETFGIGAAGLLVGFAAAFVGLRLTRFEWRDGQLFYVANPYFGMAVLALFILRLVLRFSEISSTVSTSGGAGANPFGTGATFDPLTVALLLLYTGYWIYYSVGILVRGRRMPGPA